MPASVAMSSRLVAANPDLAKASVAAVRICSRRCARGRRRTGSGLSSAMRTPFILFTPECTCEYVYLQIHNLGGVDGRPDHHRGRRHQAVPRWHPRSRRADPHNSARHRLRLARSQRCGQDHPHPHPGHPAAPRHRHRPRRRARCRPRSGGGARTDRPCRAIRRRRRPAYGPREHHHDRPPLRPVPPRGRRPRRTDPRPHPPRPGRRRDHRAAHHPVPGRGRPARRAHRGHRPRPPARRRHHCRTQRPHRRRSRRNRSTRGPERPGADGPRTAGRAARPGPRPDRAARTAWPAHPQARTASARPGRHHPDRRRTTPPDPRRLLPRPHPRQRPRTRLEARVTTVIPIRRHGRAFVHVGVITRRNLLANVRLPDVLILSTVQPVVFMLIFLYVFGGAIQAALPAAAQGEYIYWLMPGILAQFAVFGSAPTAYGLNNDRTTGVLDRFRSLPMARSAVLIGRTLSDLVRNSFILTLQVVAGVLLGFRWRNGIGGMLAAIGLALAFGYACSWLMAYIGLKIGRA